MKKNIIFFAIFGFLISLADTKAEEMHFTLALARNVITPAEETVTYAVPKQLGYFKQENLNVSYLLTDGSTAVIQAVASGSADAGYASSMNIAAAVDKGVPVKAFAGKIGRASCRERV